MSKLHSVSVTVNGRTWERQVESRLLLSDFLRHELGLTGTHVGCEHGVCGACTILLDGQSIRSCLIFAVQTHGHEIATVEGLRAGGMDRERLKLSARVLDEELGGCLQLRRPGRGHANQVVVVDVRSR